MSDPTSKSNMRIPPWVWVLCVAIASIEPLTHLWITHGLPEGIAPTGLHGGDSHMYLIAMDAGHNGWDSPYASADAPSHDPTYFNVPTHRVYAVLGWVVHTLGIDRFFALGLLNGLSMFAYLIAAFYFLRAVAPRLHRLAFALFALAGGIGGPMYLLARATGAVHNPSFEALFGRHAAYTLMEGAHLWPMLHAPRLYYTLSMAAMLVAITIMLRERPGAWRVGLAIVLAFLAQIINMRTGTFFFAMGSVAILFTHLPWRSRVFAVTALFVPIAAGAQITLSAITNHPSYTANVYGGIGETILFSALLSATVLHLLIAHREVARGITGLSALWRLGAFAIIGYLGAWIALYAAYQFYYGTGLQWGDVTSAIVISDWALVGIPIGLILSRFTPAREDDGKLDDVRWAIVWLGIAVAVGISAWGQGAFMSLLPRRLLVAIGLPLCLVTASAIMRMGARHPLRARGALVVLLACGLSSSAVGALYFQGPLGHTPGQGPFARTHYEAMTDHDVELLDALGEGRVLAPMFNPFTFGDVIALRGNPVVGAVGTLNHSDRAFEPTKTSIEKFFDSATDHPYRIELLQREQVAYVYCPDTCPVDEDVIAALDELPMTKAIARAGRGVVFEVVMEPLME